jgi:transposase-like protein
MLFLHLRFGTVGAAVHEFHSRIEADHGQLNRRLRQMRGLKSDAGARAVVAGHAFVQNLSRGRYELAIDARPKLRVAVASGGLAHAA